MENLNILPIIVAALSAIILNFLWYYPKVFGNRWAKETGITQESIKNNSTLLTYGLSIAFAILLALFIFEKSTHIEALNFVNGMLEGLKVVGFVIAPVLAISALQERRSCIYMLITIGYWAVAAALMGGIIFVWQ